MAGGREALGLGLGGGVWLCAVKEARVAVRGQGSGNSAPMHGVAR